MHANSTPANLHVRKCNGRSKLPKLISPKQIMSQASIWALDQPSKLQSLLRSSLEAAEDHDRDYCETNFQNRQFLSYRHVIHIKKFLRSYWLQIWNKKSLFLYKKRWFRTIFVTKIDMFEGKNFLKSIFIAEKSKNHKKLLYQKKVGMLICKSQEIWSYL